MKFRAGHFPNTIRQKGVGLRLIITNDIPDEAAAGEFSRRCEMGSAIASAAPSLPRPPFAREEGRAGRAGGQGIGVRARR